MAKEAHRTERKKPADPASRLLAGDLDSFTADRDALAKALAAEGKADEAKAVKAMRRPTLSAWAVNRLAHDAPEDLASLFEAADRIRGGKGDALREAMRDRTAAHSRALAKVKSILEASGHAAQPETLRRVGRTLHAAEVGASARARVEAGSVTEDLDESLLEDDEAPPPKSTRSHAAHDAHSTTKHEGAAKERRAEREARERAQRERQKHEAEVKRLEHELDVARRSMEAAERRLAHAQSSLESARRAHEAANEEASEARRRHEQAERAWRAAVDAAASNE